MIILGIESSCDETAAAIVTSQKEICSNIVWSQLKNHQPYGGVVPEIAARAHIEMMDKVIIQALETANLSLSQIDLIAFTGGPGLIGGVMVGVMTAKALALITSKPLIAVNHLEGHALTVRLTDEVNFPYLLLLISGGHCQWLAVEGVGKYQRLGGTRDDALGEAFDKTAKMLGLPYPGGPQIEEMAKLGDSQRFELPRPLIHTESCDFSFSGLKTAILHKVQELSSTKGRLEQQDIYDICASFQKVAGDCLLNRLEYATAYYEKLGYQCKQLVVAGGVAANRNLHQRLADKCDALGYQLMLPPPVLCTDNAVMIAWAGYESYAAGNRTTLDFEPKARWPLHA